MCEECPENPSVCTKCIENRVNIPHCVCPIGYFDDKNSPKCQKCDYKCAECTQIYTNCTICAQNRINIPTCECPRGFSDDLINPIC
jgi:proprotein convertase subtilisin/kexin type 5